MFKFISNLFKSNPKIRNSIKIRKTRWSGDQRKLSLGEVRRYYQDYMFFVLNKFREREYKHIAFSSSGDLLPLRLVVGGDEDLIITCPEVFDDTAENLYIQFDKKFTVYPNHRDFYVGYDYGVSLRAFIEDNIDQFLNMLGEESIGLCNQFNIKEIHSVIQESSTGKIYKVEANKGSYRVMYSDEQGNPLPFFSGFHAYQEMMRD